MLGSYIRITVDPTFDGDSAAVHETGSGLRVICGTASDVGGRNSGSAKVYIFSPTVLRGIVKLRVIAVITDEQTHQVSYVAAPDKTKVFEPEIRELISPLADLSKSRIVCLYEKSCGAIVFRRHSGNVEFLLIKNKKGGNWGFPKGHIEAGETEHDTAKREVLEETGLHIEPMEGFRELSEYYPHGKIFKQVVFFLAEMPDDGVISVQQSEVDRYIWADYGLAAKTFRFNNDRTVLSKARNWLKCI